MRWGTEDDVSATSRSSFHLWSIINHAGSAPDEIRQGSGKREGLLEKEKIQAHHQRDEEMKMVGPLLFRTFLPLLTSVNLIPCTSYRDVRCGHLDPGWLRRRGGRRRGVGTVRERERERTLDWKTPQAGGEEILLGECTITTTHHRLRDMTARPERGLLGLGAGWGEGGLEHSGKQSSRYQGKECAQTP